jgi:Na+-translocating ferredoxin:NAD+ oxidoreductase subunit G
LERFPRLRVLALARLLAAAAAFSVAAVAGAKVFLTVEEALKLAFPAAAIERRTAYLTEAQQKAVQKLSGDEEPPSALVTYYVASKEGRLVGTAYLDTHTVRTMPETILVAVDPAGAVVRVEVLSFSEPEEYMPREHWYAQFQGKPLDDELSMKRGIRAVTGATLTARATTDTARRVLALQRVLSTPAERK